MAQLTKKWTPSEIRYRLDVCHPAEPCTIKKGYDLPIGQVLGRITATGKYGPYDDAAVDGRAVASGILAEPVNASAVAGANSPTPMDMDVQAAMYVAGHFKLTKLTGWNAAAAVDLGAREVPGTDCLIIPS